MSNEMMEFRITSDLNTLRGQVISANFDEVRQWLDTNLEPYRQLAVTEDSMAQAKSYRATIRKVADRIDACRKEAKAAALAPYMPFEEKCKALTAMCAEAANSIDEQVKAIEGADREAKMAELKAYFEENATEVSDYLKWEDIINPSWGNKGYALSTAKQDIAEAISNAAGDIAAIREFGDLDVAYLLQVYAETHSLGAVMQKQSALNAERKRESMRKLEELRQKEMEDAVRAEDEFPEEEVKTPVEPFFPQDDTLVTVAFKVICTKEQLKALGQYMRDNGIRYGRP